MSELLTLEVPENLSGVRLDRALPELIPGQSRSAIARFIEEARVSIDGAVVTKSSTKVVAGSEIRVEIPDPRPSEVVAQDLPINVLYDDADIVVIDKPAGLVVHPSAGHVDGTLVNALLHHVGGLSGIGGEERPGIVHRLDKDTSGVMVVAKNDLAHRRLSEAWGTTDVVKTYFAIVYGTPKEAKGTIDRPVGRHPRDRKRMAVVESGRRAVTHYEVARELSYASLLRCRLETGRTHQIRVHLKALGHPVIGDPLYSGPQWKGVPDKLMQKAMRGFGRQALHAAVLSFSHPMSGARVEIEAPTPSDMVALLDALEP